MVELISLPRHTTRQASMVELELVPSIIFVNMLGCVQGNVLKSISAILSEKSKMIIYQIFLLNLLDKVIYES